MFITRPDGNVVEVDDEAAINRLLAQAHWRQSTEAEIENYRVKKESMIQRTEANSAGSLEDSIYYQSVSSSPDGYGMSRDFLKQELLQLGFHLVETYEKQKIGLLYSYPNTITKMENQVRLIYTMFESDKIPDDWPEFLSAANEVIVPSKFCHDAFLRSGIATTIVPLGYNDRLFTYIERDIPVKNDDVFTFIHYDSFNLRKGFNEVFQAFNAEFKNNEKVRLILKSVHPKPPIPILRSQYPNIETISGKLTEAELLELLGTAHCMVYPSRGEGFGLTPLEAMATGMPAIVPNAHGISEYFNAQYMLECKVESKVPATYENYKMTDVGNMIMVDVKDLQKKMRYAFNHQEEMKALGRSASDYVKRWTYKQTAEGMAKVLAKWQQAEVFTRPDSKHLSVERV